MGRWRADLDVGQAAAVTEAFAPALEAVGYDL